MTISRPLFRPLAIAASCAVVLAIAACAGSSASPGMFSPSSGGTVSGDVSLANSPAFHYPADAVVSSPDPRIGLKAGESVAEAGVAAWNMRLISHSPATEGFTGRGATGSDIAFTGKYAIQGNYRGWQTWDISNPSAPKLVVGFLCPS